MVNTTKQNEEKNENMLNKLLKSRTIIISNAIDQEMADKIIKQILVLEIDAPDKEIKVLINSPGGEIHSGFAIYDILHFVPCSITTIIAGLAASMGSILSLAGDQGRCFAFPNAKIMIHQPLLNGVRGNVSDLEIHSKEIIKTKEYIGKIYQKKTQKDFQQIMKDIDRDYWMTADEALKYGLIDKIITKREEI